MRSYLPGSCSVALVVMALALNGCSGSSAPISVSLTPASAQAVDVGFGVSLQATVTGSDKGVTWKISGPGSFPSQTSTAATYQAPTTVTSSQQVTVTATSVADWTKTASVQITVNPGPSIPNQNLPSGTAGVPYSQPVQLIGGSAPLNWGIYNGPILTGWEVGGSVPDGLTLDPATGVISGTPTGGGTWYFEATVIDAFGLSSLNGFLSLQINPAPVGSVNPVPFLNQPLVPGSIAPGGSGFTLKASGAGFVSGSTIDFNGTALATTFVDRDHLSAVVPAADVATAQTASVTVMNPAPGGGASNVVYLPVSAQHASVSFENATNSPLQMVGVAGLAAVDLNHDGKQDLALSQEVKVYAMQGKGDGTFASAPDSPVSIPSPPYEDYGTPYLGPIAVGDFNNSGNPGLAVGMADNDAAAILLGSANGTLTPSPAAFAYAYYLNTNALAAADFNADGNLDLAMVNFNTSFVELGYGKGAFNVGATLNAPEGAFMSGAAVGDFNGDGNLDVAVADGGSTTYPYSGMDLSLGNGDGTFLQTDGAPVFFGQDVSGIVAGDFNGDGKLDLAMPDYAGNTVFLLLGNGDGTFQQPVTFPVGEGPEAIVAGDFNNDGKLDLVTMNDGDETLTLLLGNGDGTFTQASGSPYTVGATPLAIAAADFNGDGKLDLAVSNGAAVIIWLQQ